MGGWFLFAKMADPFRKVAALDVAAYVASGKSLRGNTYRMEGEVMTPLAWSPTGRLISVGVEGGKMLPVLLPEALNEFAIEKGQRVRVLVVVEDGGVLRAEKVANP